MLPDPKLVRLAPAPRAPSALPKAPSRSLRSGRAPAALLPLNRPTPGCCAGVVVACMPVGAANAAPRRSGSAAEPPSALPKAPTPPPKSNRAPATPPPMGCPSPGRCTDAAADRLVGAANAALRHPGVAAGSPGGRACPAKSKIPDATPPSIRGRVSATPKGVAMQVGGAYAAPKRSCDAASPSW